MLLVFDIGNTNIVVGVFKGQELVAEFRLKSDPRRTVDEHRALITTLLREKISAESKISSCIVSSVVPTITPLISAYVSDQFNITPLIVGPGIKTGMPIKITEPSSVGADRIVNAVAAKVKHGAPVLVVDFGTATSFDYVSKEGCYEGGIIAPGLLVSLESLVRSTAKLPLIELLWPKTVIGKSTVSAMQSGTVMGYVCMVDGLINLIAEEVGMMPKVLATGGLGRLITEHSKKIEHYERDLTLHGLRLIAEMNL